MPRRVSRLPGEFGSSVGRWVWGISAGLSYECVPVPNKPHGFCGR